MVVIATAAQSGQAPPWTDVVLGEIRPCGVIVVAKHIPRVASDVVESDRALDVI